MLLAYPSQEDALRNLYDQARQSVRPGTSRAGGRGSQVHDTEVRAHCRASPGFGRSLRESRQPAPGRLGQHASYPAPTQGLKLATSKDSHCSDKIAFDVLRHSEGLDRGTTWPCSARAREAKRVFADTLFRVCRFKPTVGVV